MKRTALLVMICFGSTWYCANAQSTKTESTKDSLVKKQDNFLDLASKSLTGLLGDSLQGNPNGITEGIAFLELLEKTEFSEQEKEEYRKVYIGQSQGLTKKQKDSLDRVFFQKILEKEQTKIDEKP
ncbi:MAG: hypothetical protein AAF634_05785 [Bacteroidota bacterium]